MTRTADNIATPDAPLQCRKGALPAPCSTGALSPVSPRTPSRRGAVLFEALMALIVLVTSIFAFTAIFNRSASRMAGSNRNRDAALFADSVLNTLRAVSEEQARQTNWFGFWTDFLSASPAVNVAHPFPDSWSNQDSMASALLIHGTSSWHSANPLATDFGTIAYGSNTPGSTLSSGTLRTNVFGWYRSHMADEAGQANLFGGNERILPSEATTRRSAFRHRISACFMSDSVGITNRVGILVEVWPGQSGQRSATNRVAMYAEFVDQGVL